MGQISSPGNVFLFLAVLRKPGMNMDTVFEKLTWNFGPISNSYGPVPFNYTEYYSDEMGSGLDKTYHLFERPIKRDDIADAKIFTNNIEKEFSAGDKRVVNLDPGYLARDKLVLATTKDFFHRLYIGKGIFAEVTLHFKSTGVCRYFSWTYQDYRAEGFYQFILDARQKIVW
jgi:hypothetical protein